MPPIYPELPIVTPDPPPPPRKTQAEKYGGLLYAGIAGLVVTMALLAYFGMGVRSLGGVLGAVYRLHDPRTSEAGRIEAAFALRHDPKFTQRQAYDIAVEGRKLPPLARYLVAESLTAEAAEADPRAYALAVERSTGWPDWFRLLMLRPMAYAAVRGAKFPPKSLEALMRNPDPILATWARFVAAANGDRDAERTLAAEAEGDALAKLLSSALAGGQGVEIRERMLDDATLWVRGHHPGAVAAWNGWAEREGRLVPAPELLPEGPGEARPPAGPPAPSPRVKESPR